MTIASFWGAPNNAGTHYVAKVTKMNADIKFAA